MQQRRIRAVLEALLQDRQGSTFTEYMAVVGAFGIVVGAVLTTRAQTLVIDFANARDLVLLPAL